MRCILKRFYEEMKFHFPFSYCFFSSSLLYVCVCMCLGFSFFSAFFQVCSLLKSIVYRVAGFSFLALIKCLLFELFFTASSNEFGSHKLKFVFKSPENWFLSCTDLDF